MQAPPAEGLVSIVTPCLNGAAFLEQTISSVLAQTYADIEYALVDGGSTDASLAIARSFGARVRALELPGSSQARAINAGLESAGGEFFAFLNADDVLEPSAVERAVAALRAAPDAPYAYGGAEFIDANGSTLGPYPVRAFSRSDLMHECFICQPATLIRTSALRAVGGFDESYDIAFDYDLWIRLAERFAPPVQVDGPLARVRMHGDSKTFRMRASGFREICKLVGRHYGYVPFNWVHAWAGAVTDRADQFFQPPTGTPRRTLLTLVLGVRENRRHPTRFLNEFGREVLRLRRLARQTGRSS